MQPNVDKAATAGQRLGARGGHGRIHDRTDVESGLGGDAEQQPELRGGRGGGRRDDQIRAVKARGFTHGAQLQVDEIGLVRHAAPGGADRVGIQALPELVVRLSGMQARLRRGFAAELRAATFNQGYARLRVQHLAVTVQGDLGVVDVE